MHLYKWIGSSSYTESIVLSGDLFEIWISYAKLLYAMLFWKDLEKRSPTFLAPGSGFMEDNFSTDGVGRGDGFGMTLFYLSSSGIS